MSTLISDDREILLEPCMYKVINTQGLFIVSSIENCTTEDTLEQKLEVGKFVEMIGSAQEVKLLGENRQVLQFAQRVKQWLVIKHTDKFDNYLEKKIESENLYMHPIHYAINNKSPREIIKAILDGYEDAGKVVYGELLPLHRALDLGLPPETILDIIKSYPEACKIRDSNGRTCLHIAVETRSYEAFGYIAEYGGGISVLNRDKVRPKVPLDTIPKNEKNDFYFECFPKLSCEALMANEFALWFRILNISGITQIVTGLTEKFPSLIYAQDRYSGKTATSVALRGNLEAMEATILWHGRYRLVETQPFHTSATCFVYKAIDTRKKSDESANARGVRDVEYFALKLIGKREQFERELSARKKDFNEEFVVRPTDCYPANEVDYDNHTTLTPEEFEEWGKNGTTLTKTQVRLLDHKMT